jgi:hypothetical protein
MGTKCDLFLLREELYVVESKVQWTMFWPKKDEYVGNFG